MNTTMTGIEIYHLLARRNLSWSRRDASHFILKMNPSYLAQRGHLPLSHRAMLNLFTHLWQERRYVLAARVAWVILWGSPAAAEQP
jgi:hypothetical protein